MKKSWQVQLMRFLRTVRWIDSAESNKSVLFASRGEEDGIRDGQATKSER